MNAIIAIALAAVVSTSGCASTQRRSRPICRPFVSVCCAYGAAKYTAPVSPQEGCEEGCGCNGTGEERSGDDLEVVACRCPETCKCKAGNSSEIPNGSPASKQETPAPAVKTIKEPPLVPVAPKQAGNRVECINGQCYIVEPSGRRYRIIRR